RRRRDRLARVLLSRLRHSARDGGLPTGRRGVGGDPASRLIPVGAMSLTDILLHHAERFPERSALEFEGRTTTWQSLLEGTQASAGALAEAGVERGDVVAVLLHNSDRFLELMHAISHLGAIFIPLNWRLAGPELAYIIDHAGARVLVSEPELEQGVAPVEEQLACRRLRVN